MNPHHRDVLRLYKRALRLVDPYVDSPGVQDFMRSEIVRELVSHKVPKDKILEIEEHAMKRDNLAETCKHNVRTIFRDKKDERNQDEIEYLLRQGQVELDAVEDKVIKQKRNFGMRKEGGDISYVVTSKAEK